MSNKATIASDWLAGCAGCHMSLLDIDERIATLLEVASLHATPITDLKHPPASGVDVGILEGCVNNSTGEQTANPAPGAIVNALKESVAAPTAKQQRKANQ